MSASRRTSERSQHRRLGADEPEQALSAYRRRQLELAELIRGGMNLASDRRTDHRTESGRELLVRLAEDRFQLAVMGQFSRGKSTLMNAILGRPYLPTGALPMTSVITRVRYGSRPPASVRRRGGHRFPIETPLEQLSRFVAESSTEREEQQVVSADIRVPAEILRLGFSFVDTPGIGSAVAANTAATTRFLSEADAVMFVTAFDSPLSEAEMQFLTEARRHVDKLFYVVNKLDLVSADEAGQVIDFVRQRLSPDAHESGVRVFAISARDALQAKLHGTEDELADSGLPELEQALVAFLTADKARTFLLGVSARAERLLARLRLDLEIGRAASTSTSGHGDPPGAVFNQRVEALIASEQRVADRLAERVESELPRLLAARADRWAQDLRRPLLAELEAQWPAPRGRRDDVRLGAGGSRALERPRPAPARRLARRTCGRSAVSPHRTRRPRARRALLDARVDRRPGRSELQRPVRRFDGRSGVVTRRAATARHTTGAAAYRTATFAARRSAIA